MPARRPRVDAHAESALCDPPIRYCAKPPAEVQDEEELGEKKKPSSSPGRLINRSKAGEADDADEVASHAHSVEDEEASHGPGELASLRTRPPVEDFADFVWRTQVRGRHGPCSWLRGQHGPA